MQEKKLGFKAHNCAIVYNNLSWPCSVLGGKSSNEMDVGSDLKIVLILIIFDIIHTLCLTKEKLLL